MHPDFCRDFWLAFLAHCLINSEAMTNAERQAKHRLKVKNLCRPKGETRFVRIDPRTIIMTNKGMSDSEIIKEFREKTQCHEPVTRWTGFDYKTRIHET